MKNYLKVGLSCLVLNCLLNPGLSAETIVKQAVKAAPEPVINIMVSGIPQGQQTLFIPIMLDTNVSDLERVAIEDLSPLNILAVTSNASNMVGPGIGILKLDDKGLPSNLDFRVYLKKNSEGQTDISLVNVADIPALLVKGAEFNNEVKIGIEGLDPISVTEEINEKGKKKLKLSQNTVKLNVQRNAQKAESIFVPLVFDDKVIDLTESFGHAIISPGISAKTFSQSSLSNAGAGVEIVLSETADKDFSIDVELAPKSAGESKISTATPQKTQTAIVKGPIVEINPANISFASK